MARDQCVYVFVLWRHNEDGTQWAPGARWYALGAFGWEGTVHGSRGQES